MKKKTRPRIMNIVNINSSSRSNPSLLRVIAAQDYTRIDFAYAATDIYDFGGWIDIWPQTYLVSDKSIHRIPLKTVQNVPLSPEKLYFESTQDWCCYTLLFAPIPIEKCTIDIIESDNPSPTNFNFYGVVLEVGDEVMDES